LIGNQDGLVVLIDTDYWLLNWNARIIGNQHGFVREIGIHEEYHIIIFRMRILDRLGIKIAMPDYCWLRYENVRTIM
jgi:hypothetical protein